jgi:hypothetical protein
MKRMLIAAAMISLAACSAPKADVPSKADTPAQNAAPSYAGDFKETAYPEAVFSKPMDAVAGLIGGFPESTEGNPALDIRIVKASDSKGGLLVQATATGLLDDSISGKQWVARIASKDGNWVFSEASERWSCQRGSSGTKWVTTLCP